MGPEDAHAVAGSPVHAVIRRLRELVQEGVVRNEAIAADILASDSLVKLQQLMRNHNQAAVNSILATAATLYKQGRTDDARYLALLVLLSGRTPQKYPLKGLSFGQLISRAVVEALGEAFSPPLSLDGI